ncbi:HD domain-containing protein [Candidatus Woesearchaeota archaeon]|nr:HD domain-containing protein [Candidatus Woesearchaeota archaeon]
MSNSTLNSEEKNRILKATEEYVKKELTGESSGHDWWHTQRVWKTAVKIAKKEKADLIVVQLAALLHDIADWKFNNDNESAGSDKAKEWLDKIGVDENISNHICEIIHDLSFKGAGVKSEIKTKEGMIVQDADRLDAMGAIGIARAFATGAKFNREIYNPEIKPTLHQTAEDYKKSKGYGGSINHFYEKLLLLKDRMNTATAKKIAEKRHKFMEHYLKEFFNEWNGKA